MVRLDNAHVYQMAVMDRRMWVCTADGRSWVLFQPLRRVSVRWPSPDRRLGGPVCWWCAEFEVLHQQAPQGIWGFLPGAGKGNIHSCMHVQLCILQALAL